MTPSLRDRLNALERIYDVYQKALAPYGLACREGCDHCCTANVTLTSMEALLIIDGLGDRAGQVLAPVEKSLNPRRFRPLVTINTIAAMTLAGDDPPEEGADPAAGPCPLLVSRRCSIYPLRPFACRCMVSTRPCTVAGYATIDDFLLTVNTVFQQVIEDLDSRGCTGNFSDVLPHLYRPEASAARGRQDPECPSLDLAPNRPMPALMVPPEHRARIDPIIDALRNIRIWRTPPSP